MRSRRLALPTVMALTVALTTTAVVSTAPSANAADQFTCKSSVPIFDIRESGQLHINHHQEPETGVNSWANWNHVSSGWPASSYAGPGGKMYFINAAGELHQQTWTGTGWANNGTP